MNSRVVTVVLVLVVVALAGLSFYLYSGVNEAKSVAIDLGGKLQACGAGLEQAKSGVSACQEILAGLAQVPACASLIPQL